MNQTRSRRQYTKLMTAGTAVLLLCAAAPPAHAQPQERVSPSGAVRIAQADAMVFDIAPQPLRSALTAFAEQSGWQLFYSAQMAEGLESPGVSGVLAPDAALAQILTGTRLTVAVTAPRTVTLVEAAAPPVRSHESPQPSVSDAPIQAPPPPVAKQKVIKLPETVVKETRLRDDTTSYVAEEANTATRTDTPIKNVPQSIQVVTRKVIEEQRALRLEDVLGNISGFNMGSSGQNLWDTFMIRGFLANESSYFRNGLLDQAARYYASDTYNVRRVEVLKGPASVLYGQGDPGGIVNIVTNRPLPHAAYSTTTTLGNFNLYRSELDATGPLNAGKTLLYRLNVAGQRADSYVDFVNRDLAAVAPSLTWLMDSRTTLTIEGDYLRRWGKDPNDLPAQGTVLGNVHGHIPRNRFTGQPNDSFRAQVYRIGYDLTHQLNDHWSFRNTYRQSIATEDQNRQVTFGLALDADQRTLNRGQVFQPLMGRFHAHSMVTNLVGHVRALDMDHTLLTGVELRQDKTDQYMVRFNSAPPLDLFAPVYPSASPNTGADTIFLRDVKAAAFYLQDQITIVPSLTFVGGLRFDFVHQSVQTDQGSTASDDQAVSPRLGLVYSPIEPLSFYTSWTKGFTPNSPNSRNGNGALFKPERSTQYEIGVKAALPDNRLSATLAWFHLTRDNLTTPDPTLALANLGFQVQTGAQRSQGIELDVTAQVTPGWNVIASYAYTDAEVTQDNNLALLHRRLANVPYNRFTLWSTYYMQEGILKGFGVGGGVYASSSRTASLFGEPVDMPAYARADAALYYTRALEPGSWIGAKSLRCSLNIQNLLDHRYVRGSSFGSASAFFYGEPLTVMGTVGLAF